MDLDAGKFLKNRINSPQKKQTGFAVTLHNPTPREDYVIDQAATVGGSTLYSANERWCQRNHYMPTKNKLFGMEVKKRFAKKRDNQGMHY
jgi:hypothetical protein